MNGVNDVNNVFFDFTVNLSNKLKVISAELSFCGLKPDIQALFYILKIDCYSDIYFDRNDATAGSKNMVRRRLALV
jgi:hypothetical protein